MKYYVLNLALVIVSFFSMTACNGAKKATTAEMPAGKSYNLSGNEPFWNVKIEDSGITFTQMGGDAVYFPASVAKAGGSNRIYDTSTTLDGRTVEMRIIMEDKPCNDTMADKTYSYKVTVSMDGKTYKGCGEEIVM